MKVETRASAEIPAAPERVFDLVVDNANCSRFFQRWGPIPGVVSCEAAGAKDGRPRRKLQLTDRSTYEEEILALERPYRYEYRWLNPPAAPLDLVVRSAEAHWAFEETKAGGHTRIFWNYTFELTHPIAYPAALVLRVLFSRWMLQALERVRQASVNPSR